MGKTVLGATEILCILTRVVGRRNGGWGGAWGCIGGGGLTTALLVVSTQEEWAGGRSIDLGGGTNTRKMIESVAHPLGNYAIFRPTVSTKGLISIQVFICLTRREELKNRQSKAHSDVIDGRAAITCLR